MNAYMEAIWSWSLAYLVGDCSNQHYQSLNSEQKEWWKAGELGCFLLRLGVLGDSICLAWFGLGLVTSDINDHPEWRLDLWLSNS
jgi:hypothetical protein